MTTLSALNGTTYVQSTNLTSSSTSSTTSSDLDDLEQKKADFLNILLTQLQNQNPLDPMDTNEYTAQLVQYSELEQLIDLNGNASSILTALSSNATSSNLAYIGKTAEIDSSTSVVQDGQVSWSYSIDGTPSHVYLTVTDSDGNTLYSGEASNTSADGAFVLDTTDSGLADGTVLNLSVNAVDSSGDSIDNSISSYVTIDGVQSDGDTSYLTAGGLSFTLSNVLKFS
ncbi:MAG: hypothetical protein LRY36_00490 [Alphaproteobacteria bacterium]|nr:hypothetical protein [Alphaproteobacteria bacterium]